MSVTRNALLIVTVGALLAGCGVRGPLQAPKADSLSTGSSAAANAAPPATSPTATADSGQGKPENTAAKPHQGFILDGLLR